MCGLAARYPFYGNGLPGVRIEAKLIFYIQYWYRIFKQESAKRLMEHIRFKGTGDFHTDSRTVNM